MLNKHKISHVPTISATLQKKILYKTQNFMVIDRSIHHYSYSNYSSMATEIPIHFPHQSSQQNLKIPPAFPPQW